MDVKFGTTAYYLCDLEQIMEALSISILSSVEWEQYGNKYSHWIVPRVKENNVAM